MNTFSTAVVVTFGLFAGSVSAAELLALGSDGTLHTIDSESLKVTGTTQVMSKAPLRGIDVRPASGELYALAGDNQLYTLDPETGSLSAKSKLAQALPGNGQAVVDFNPVADRLRLLAADGTNFRVNVDTGEVVLDGEVSYATDGPHAGKTANVMAGAYTNSYAGTESTSLYTVDLATGQLMLQNPPNDGVQQVVGVIAEELGQVAFDIASDGKGDNTAWLLTGTTLHRVDLESGKPTTLGEVADLPEGVIDMAVMP
ncbi:DUF4394 domain-containing protein [Halopseudomonas nanhaiensis]|uniref:DUF4394 domain-containing protein n=1 Tax=Halopseudomonas nanhaiensis TaxID=2830842 RepID=UPI001CBC392F|nr:DUF4394 domain-containing protein [Halopseudomonas nanhaiensis]